MSHLIAEVGKFYDVPCVRLLVKRASQQHPAAGRSGWIPTIGPEHHDRGLIGFRAMHLHIDVRFISDAVLDRAGVSAQSLMGFPVSTWSDGDGGPAIPHETASRRMRCRRETLDFPSGLARWFPKLEAEHAECRLKPGNICPHRGIDLTPFIKPDGTVICPGHGLRWNTVTGDLMPHHAADARAQPATQAAAA